jgi:hypothetical protein
MATTDTRSGFRLPWSSDRSNDTTAVDETATAAGEAVAEGAQAESSAWPTADVATSARPDPESPSTETAAPAEESAMLDLQPSPAQPATAPRKPSKLMADLSAAIRSTAETARDQALAQVEADAAAVVEAIRAGAKDGEQALRVRSDEDVAGIKEWSRAEIARIKEETERRIEARKLGLDEELAAHAAAIEQRVGAVESTVAGYRNEMGAYAERLGHEDDPARLATLAETMPEPPVLEALSDLSDLPAVAEPPAVAELLAEDGDFPQDVIAARLAGVAIVAEPEAVEPEAAAAWPEAQPVQPDSPDAAAVVTGAWATPSSTTPAGESAADAASVETAPPAAPRASGSTWGERESAWSTPAATAIEAAGSSDSEPSPEAVLVAAETDADDAVDRGLIMTALEADAEAVASAESAVLQDAIVDDAVAEDIAEDIAESGDGSELDAEAAAALAARMGSIGFDASFADRIASLMPTAVQDETAVESAVTQVVVGGLVSVASIASFKRHLGRLPGVEGVTVASGPDGEFVFNVTHRPDVAFRDAIPSLPGFAARVTASAEGVVQVTARDPEAEG